MMGLRKYRDFALRAQSLELGNVEAKLRCGDWRKTFSIVAGRTGMDRQLFHSRLEVDNLGDHHCSRSSNKMEVHRKASNRGCVR